MNVKDLPTEAEELKLEVRKFFSTKLIFLLISKYLL